MLSTGTGASSGTSASHPLAEPSPSSDEYSGISRALREEEEVEEAGPGAPAAPAPPPAAPFGAADAPPDAGADVPVFFVLFLAKKELSAFLLPTVAGAGADMLSFSGEEEGEEEGSRKGGWENSGLRRRRAEGRALGLSAPHAVRRAGLLGRWR
jgi:hypothetical protein